MWPALRYRPLQALALLGLSALVTACAVFAPLQDRAIKQESAAVRIDRSSVRLTGIGLTSQSGPSNPALPPDRLVGLVSSSLRRFFAPAVTGASVSVAVASGGSGAIASTVRSRADVCAHVRFVSGRCPRGYGEVAVSAADARLHSWGPGTRVPVVEQILDPVLQKAHARTPVVTLRVTGVYRQSPSAYWFGTELTGRSGTFDRDTAQPQADDLLTARRTVDGASAPAWVAPSFQVDLALLRDRVGLDELLRIGPQVTRLVQDPLGPDGTGEDRAPLVIPYSGLPDLAASTARDVRQVGTTVPLLVAQLALLAMVVLWLLLGAALDQRRPDLAVARLRGRGVRGARALVLREQLVVVLAGVPLGCVVAVAASLAARTAWLPVATPFEVRTPVLVGLGVAVVGLSSVTFAATQRVVREPVHALLRRVPPRRSGWSGSVAEVLLVGLSVAAVVLVATGDLRGPVAVAAPTLLALSVGLVLGQLLAPVAAGGGRRLLAAGRLSAGVALLQVARGPSTRRVVAVLTVATALLVFCSDALAVGTRNRADAAEQQLGARAVTTVEGTDLGTDLGAVRAAVRAADPSGRQATVVTTATPPSSGGATTVGVEPEEFRRIALLPDSPARTGSAATWARLRPPPVPSVELRGTSVRFTIRSRVTDAGQGGPPLLQLRALTTGGVALLPLTALSQGPRAARITASLPCAAGCTLVGLALTSRSSAPVSGTVSITAMSTSSGQRDVLGPASRWVRAGGSRTTMSPADGSAPGSLTVVFTLAGDQPLVMRHASVPARLPALVTGRLPVGSRGDRFGGLDLQGIILPMTRVATLPRVPGAPRDANIVNLDVLSRTSGLGGLTTTQVWFARADPALFARVRRALSARGVAVGPTTTLSTVRRTYDETAPAWSLQLAVLVGAVGLGIGSLVLLAVAATAWRVRSRDLAALRISGVPSRTLAGVAVAVEVAPVAAAVLSGGICGVVGAHLALPRVPLFATAPEVSSLDLGTAWGEVLLALVVATVVLIGLGLVAATWLLRRTGLPRLLETG